MCVIRNNVTMAQSWDCWLSQ